MVAAALIVAATHAWAACREDVVWLRGDWGETSFRVELATTVAQRSRGLMFRDSMADDVGMLFLYQRPQALSFWMRNTYIPLDLIFLRPDGVVAHVHHRARPLDETPISGGRGLVAVLEINGGLAQQIGIAPGTQMRHPFFGGDAAWPC
ncbi:DUF192 domain-containing protein [Aliishimia ponticola]|uniref:DUF192 domain-containing protein n=1 Tax=Aliishimia ponticola TaxID=2499833 RepID=A0A4S4NLK2_9RHOB|nr:DUF192 domain-containing protein [Aliishimia ponticola]